MSKFSKLSREALFLGQSERPGRRRWAKSRVGALPGADDAVLCPRGNAPHLLTIAPNRSGRDRSCLIPNLLNYAGQVVVLDIDGRAYAATEAARRALGQRVVRLDPFDLTGPKQDTYTTLDWIVDPYDSLDWKDSILAPACREVAELFSRGPSFGDADEDEAIGLISAIIGYLWVVPEKKINENELYKTLHSDDITYSLAVVLDTIGKKLPESTYAGIASFLEKGDRAHILARATSLLKAFGNLDVEASADGSTFNFPFEPPVTVYVIIPAERLKIYATPLRVWIGGMLRTALRAPDPAVPALFLLDHCAELMPFPQLEATHATVEPGKLRIWTFWHDVSQLRAAYPRDWPAMIAGCGAVQVFGTRDPEAATEAASILGLPPNDIQSLGPEEQVVRLDGVPRRLHRLGI